MMNWMTVKRITVLLLFSGLVLSCKSEEFDLPSKEEVKTVIIKVNDNWQKKHPEHGRAFWDNAAYHTGNIAAYEITGIDRYLDYSEAWAVKNDWKGATSDDKAAWKYHYGETNDHVLFGDWQICFQTYIDLFNLTEPKDSSKIARAREVMEYEMSTDRNDYWWWADGLYMVMPVMTKLYNVTGNEQYLDKLYEYFKYAQSIMYDDETGLFYRDAKYVYPRHKTLNGKKDFWARGDGWVFAGLAKIIQDMPDAYVHKTEFIKIYKRMAATLIAAQQPEGYWTRSILDPEHAPGPETSGTAFYTFALFWGMNHGILSDDDYLPAALNAWKYLTTTAIDENGRVGYVQPIGERAIPGQIVNENSTSNFGVGAVLLAASEVYRFVNNK
ncbi:glycoside hydrolase family 88 protein [Saccharicrinis sp. FJH62]|uniref:glycoside hydrolase family 88/105 protein n=1 Tax=Saccharicrinis sp. FJH62 TaxID=3344657 RepID=UPI0035D4C5FD